MLDANGDMNLAHVRARPNLSFSAEAARRVEEAAGGAETLVLVGVHLCGALSPRLVDLFLGVRHTPHPHFFFIVINIHINIISVIFFFLSLL